MKRKQKEIKSCSVINVGNEMLFLELLNKALIFRTLPITCDGPCPFWLVLSSSVV